MRENKLGKQGVLISYIKCVALSVCCMAPRSYVSAYSSGDVISMVEQSQVGGMKTKWHHVENGKKPTFAIDSVISIVPPYSRQDYDTTKRFKMIFAFSEHRFLVPWSLFSDGQGLYLDRLIFTFKHTAQDIISVHARHVYTTQVNHKPEQIFFEYIWEPAVAHRKYGEEQSANAIACLVVLPLVVISAFAIFHENAITHK